MLEVMNGFLLVYFMVLCTLSAMVSQFVKPIASCFNRPSSDERTIWEEILKLKAEQKELSMKEHFAAYSKIQRKINLLEGQLKDNSQNRISKMLAIRGTVHITLQVAVALLIIISVIIFRKEPIVTIKGNLFPIATMLRYPSDVPNAISSHIWVLICNFSIRSLLKPVLS